MVRSSPLPLRTWSETTPCDIMRKEKEYSRICISDTSPRSALQEHLRLWLCKLITVAVVRRERLSCHNLSMPQPVLLLALTDSPKNRAPGTKSKRDEKKSWCWSNTCLWRARSALDATSTLLWTMSWAANELMWSCFCLFKCMSAWSSKKIVGGWRDRVPYSTIRYWCDYFDMPFKRFDQHERAHLRDELSCEQSYSSHWIGVHNRRRNKESSP